MSLVLESDGIPEAMMGGKQWFKHIVELPFDLIVGHISRHSFPPIF